MHCKSKLAVSITATVLLSLLSATSYAGWYCVKTPTGGNSGWTKRDNAISIRFKYYFTATNSKGVLKGPLTTDGRGAFDVPYTEYGYNDPHVCADMRRMEWDLKHWLATVSNWPADSQVTLDGVQADIRYGGDCPKISDLKKNVLFRTWRRSGNHVNPWDCGGPLDNINWNLLTKYNMPKGAHKPVSVIGLKQELLDAADAILSAKTTKTANRPSVAQINAQVKETKSKVQAVKLPTAPPSEDAHPLGDLAKLPDYRYEMHILSNKAKFSDAVAVLIARAKKAQDAASKKGRHDIVARCKEMVRQLSSDSIYRSGGIAMDKIETQLHRFYRDLRLKPEKRLHLVKK